MKRRKWIAPIIITVFVVAYYIIYFGTLIYLLNSTWAIFLGIIPFTLAATMVYVCVQRIKEIRSGEEDDLSQY